MVIKANIEGLEINRVLIYSGRSTEIIFAKAFDQMKLSISQLQPSDSPLIGFGGKKIYVLGKTSLPVSFKDQENARIEYVTFDVVDLYYLYNAIFGKGFSNKFNIAIHMGYLCMKIPALHDIITVHGSQKEARNIKRAIYKSQRNINSIEVAKNNTLEPPDMPKDKMGLRDQEETMSAPLENAVLDIKVIIRCNLSKKKRQSS